MTTNNLQDELIRSITENIFATLQKEKFFHWYNSGNFHAFISGGDEMEKVFGTQSSLIAEALVKQQIQQLFNIWFDTE